MTHNPSDALRVILVREAVLTHRAAQQSFNELAAGLGVKDESQRALLVNALGQLAGSDVSRFEIDASHAAMLARAIGKE